MEKVRRTGRRPKPATKTPVSEVTFNEATMHFTRGLSKRVNQQPPQATGSKEFCQHQDVVFEQQTSESQDAAPSNSVNESDISTDVGSQQNDGNYEILTEKRLRAEAEARADALGRRVGLLEKRSASDDKRINRLTSENTAKKNKIQQLKRKMREKQKLWSEEKRALLAQLNEKKNHSKGSRRLIESDDDDVISLGSQNGFGSPRSNVNFEVFGCSDDEGAARGGRTNQNSIADVMMSDVEDESTMSSVESSPHDQANVELPDESNDERVFSCKTCGKRFNCSQTWSRHKSQHFARFKCRVCEKAYNRKDNLKRHVNKIHGLQ